MRSESSAPTRRSEEHTSELQSHSDLVCRLLLEKKKLRSATAPFFTNQNPLKLRVGSLYAFLRASLRGLFFFLNDTATTEIYTLSLHDALPIFGVFGPNP